MNILMVTNTFTPHVGGVARSVQSFTDEYRKLGHRVFVVAPVSPVSSASMREQDVYRVAAFADVNGSSFSLPVLSPKVRSALEMFFSVNRLDVVHSHHPFLLGSVARQLSDRFRVPLVFTHHTMYEQFTYSMGEVGSFAVAKDAVAEVATSYANECDLIFTPSPSTKDIVAQRGVITPIEVLPTGVDVERFASGDRTALRKRLGIPQDDFVIGYVGRLAPEKNLEFLCDAVGLLTTRFPRIHYVIVGDGPHRSTLESRCANRARLHFLGSLSGKDLVDAYAALNVFAFSSKSETQGMVITEAMAARVPVVGIDAPGVRDVLRHGVNGMVAPETVEGFASAVRAAHFANKSGALSDGAQHTASGISLRRCAERAVSLYEEAVFEQKKYRAAVGFVHKLAKKTFGGRAP